MAIDCSIRSDATRQGGVGAMKAVLNMLSFAVLALVLGAAPVLAQDAQGAEARLKQKNITLPPEAAPIANYVNAVRVGNLLFLAGNTSGPQWQPNGKVGKDLTVEQGRAAARQAGLIMLAKVRGALGSLDRVKRIVKVLGMCDSGEGFGDQPTVINVFSFLMVEFFGVE